VFETRQIDEGKGVGGHRLRLVAAVGLCSIEVDFKKLSMLKYRIRLQHLTWWWWGVPR